MPQFAFSATDRMGNVVEGTVSAADMSLAADQVRQMGYTPQRVQLAVETTQTLAVGVGGGAEATATMNAAPAAPYAPPRPGLIDLTQAYAEYPLDSPTATSAPASDDPNATFERLEPWQRGGAVSQPPAPTLKMNSEGRIVVPPAPVEANPYAIEPPEGKETPHTERPSIPYRAGLKRNVPLPQRFMEVMIYPLFAGVVIKDLAPFFRQFATLINAGLPIYQALVGLEANTTNAKLKEVARAGQEQVQAGGRFSDVMGAYPWIFQPMQIELIRAAEQGGMLDKALLQVSEYIEHELEIRRLISRETFYPKMVLFVALMILGRGGFMGGQMALVGLVLGGMGKAPYTFWNYLMDTLGFGLMCLLPFVVFVAVFRLFLFNVPGVREGYDTFKMLIPGLGKLVKMFAVAKFMRTYAALYRAGFAMGSALEVAGDACGNAVIRNAAHGAIRSAERGGSVSAALAASGYFPVMAVDMLRTGETTGSLDAMLDSVADYYEAEGKLKSHQIALIFSVGVFLLVAILVGVQIISFCMGHANDVMHSGGE